MKRYPPLYYNKPQLIIPADVYSQEFEHLRDFKVLPSRGLCAILPLMFTYGVAHGIGKDGVQIGRWCYKTYQEAKEALDQWTGVGDPPGMWVKYKGQTMEYINPLRIGEYIEYRGQEKEYFETTIHYDPSTTPVRRH